MAAASTATINSSHLLTHLLLLLLIIIIIPTPTDSHLTTTSALRRDLLAYKGRKKPVAAVTASPRCGEMGSKAECLGRSSRCRWCRSDALDDMCLGFSEAWRLPPQVFSCE